MDCRPACGACCIYLSISSPIPGMPDGKPAGLRCIHLDEDLKCRIYRHPDRPAVCAKLKPDPDFCGSSPEQAARIMTELEE